MNLIDWQALDPYREMMGDDFVIDILQTYLSNSQELLRDIEGNFPAGNLATLTRAAHTLKSNSAMLGASNLADICLKIEKAGKDGNLQGLQPDIEALREQHALVCAEIKGRLEKGG